MMHEIHHIKNSKRWVKLSLNKRLLMSVVLTLFVFSLRYALHDLLQDRMVFLLFLINAQIIAFYCGATFGFLSLFAGGGLALYYFVEPYQSFSILTSDDALRLTGYFMVSMLSIIMIEYLQRARYATLLLLMMSQSRYHCLVRLNQYLMHIQKK